MVDNFEIIKPLLTFENEGDCYYLQLLRRQSDDPMLDGIPDPTYHGNMHSRSIKDYFITSIEHLEQRKAEIIKICETFNVRAYIRLNKRNYKNISLEMMKHIVEQWTSGETYSSPFHLVASAAGIANCAGKGNKTWIVDCDAEHKPYIDKIEEIIFSCEPYASKEAPGRLTRIPSKSGVHLIPHPFNSNIFEKRWNLYAIENDITAPLPQYKVEGDVIHFSLSGPYLKYVNSLLAICQTPPAEASLEKIDKNKTMIHAYGRTIEAIAADWNEWCTKCNFFMVSPAIHKDNPTILYVP